MKVQFKVYVPLGAAQWCVDSFDTDAEAVSRAREVVNSGESDKARVVKVTTETVHVINKT